MRFSGRIASWSVVGALAAGPAGLVQAQLVISEFRLQGPNGLNDEFIEIENIGATGHTVAAAAGTGYGIAASDGVLRCSIPNGTVIPSHGHYLCVNSVGYSLSSYPAGNGTTASGNATYTTDIAYNAGIALFNNNLGGANFTLANRFDAVGATSEANTLYKEGTGYPALSVDSVDHAFVRDACGKGGSITTFGPCPRGGHLIDTDNNALDFFFVDTNGTSLGAGQRLGAPGPENLSSPTFASAPLTVKLLDPCKPASAPPNMVRDFTSDPPNASNFGTISVRRTITNNTGGSVTRLRFRVVDLTTFPAPSGFADLRPRSSGVVIVSGVDGLPCGTGTSTVTVQGTTLEEPPTQPNKGGFDSSLSAGTVTLGTPLANGASVNLQFLLGLQQTGMWKFHVNLEALPNGGGSLLAAGGCPSNEPAGFGGPAPEADCTPGFVKGDFNDDDKSDILFRSVANGAQNKAWLMDGVTRLSEALIVPDATSSDWLIRGADDFDTQGAPGTGPDGKTDLVFWNQTTGNVEFWLMNGVTRTGSPVALTGGPPLALNWILSATADFNHDGKPDIVWRNVTSQNIVIWTMDKTAKTGQITPNPSQAAQANWTIVAAADYNDDGNTDFLWYNVTSGKLVTWYMNASVVRTTSQFTTPDSAGNNNWQVAASADYSTTTGAPFGSSDVLWRNATSGNQVVWHMDFASQRVGAAGQFTVPAANTVPLDWVIVGPR